ncbi:hypothetical protein ONV78_03260 [Hahella sp. CR1]|uniref:hypothetical protein n=1 Tax=Hahella sp. CR1 TaxID=2992807 RepID=UPI0024420859|nr:hypothetical protein [Hahella sp. CR1]MDG9666741.1 hypothetical protein [Hahella sp. CR1]
MDAKFITKKLISALKSQLRLLPININDAMFFTAIGVITSTGIHTSSLIKLPTNMDRDYFNKILFDHLPILSIASLWLVVTILSLLRMIISKHTKTYKIVSLQARHLSERVSQLFSPAFFVLLGVSVTTFCIFLCKKEEVYYQLSVLVLFFDAIMLILCTLVNFISEDSNARYPLSIQKLSIALLIFIPSTLIFYAVTNEKKIEVSTEFTISEIDHIKEAAKIENLNISEFIHQAALSRYNSHNLEGK